jgi:hypothetical protein
LLQTAQKWSWCANYGDKKHYILRSIWPPVECTLIYRFTYVQCYAYNSSISSWLLNAWSFFWFLGAFNAYEISWSGSLFCVKFSHFQYVYPVHSVNWFLLCSVTLRIYFVQPWSDGPVHLPDVYLPVPSLELRAYLSFILIVGSETALIAGSLTEVFCNMHFVCIIIVPCNQSVPFDCHCLRIMIKLSRIQLTDDLFGDAYWSHGGIISFLCTKYCLSIFWIRLSAELLIFFSRVLLSELLFIKHVFSIANAYAAGQGLRQ